MLYTLILARAVLVVYVAAGSCTHYILYLVCLYISFYVQSWQPGAYQIEQIDRWQHKDAMSTFWRN